nr:MAG TPA: hypothetical protein [Caudoviricetes sp.]
MLKMDILTLRKNIISSISKLQGLYEILVNMNFEK